MYFLLILFFTSLLGIILILGRKWILIRNGQVVPSDIDEIGEIPYVAEWKDLVTRNVRKWSFAALVIGVRMYVIFSNFIKNKYEIVRTKINLIRHKNGTAPIPEKKEPNKVLKMIADYKKKVRRIKQKVKQEEESL